MARPYFQVKYKYIKSGKTTGTSTSLSGHVNQQSEQMVMQKLRDKHKGCDIQLIELKWK